MGGCATKPKDVKAEDAAEAPAPEPAKEAAEAAGTVSEAEAKAEAEELKKVEGDISVDKVKEIVDEDKRRSLSNLFKENEGKKSPEPEKTPLDPVKQEVLSVHQNPTEVFYETNPKEYVKTETPVEQTLKEVVEAPVEAKTEKLVEVVPTGGASGEKATKPAANTELREPEEKKIVEDHKPAAAAETQKLEKPEEKKAAEEPETAEKKEEEK